MDAVAWKVAIVSSNRFEAQMLNELLHQARVWDTRMFRPGDQVLIDLHSFAANIILFELDAAHPVALDWVRHLRREKGSPSRKASVFAVTSTLTLSVAQQCRVAGVNAVIGKPVSGATVLNTITKVLARPRPFIEGDNYVGPCRRAGIVTAGAGSRRRAGDAPASEAA